MTIISIPDEKSEPTHFHITTAKEIYTIRFQDIFFIESHQKHSILHTRIGILIVPLPLYRLKEVLPPTIFLQTHRSFLVNLKKIAHINKQSDPWTIFFYGSKENAYISRSHRHQVIDAVYD